MGAGHDEGVVQHIALACELAANLGHTVETTKAQRHKGAAAHGQKKFLFVRRCVSVSLWFLTSSDFVDGPFDQLISAASDSLDGRPDFNIRKNAHTLRRALVGIEDSKAADIGTEPAGHCNCDNVSVSAGG